MIFNEQVMYNDRSIIVPDVTKIDQKKSEFAKHNKFVKSMFSKHVWQIYVTFSVRY